MKEDVTRTNYKHTSTNKHIIEMSLIDSPDSVDNLDGVVDGADLDG
jgi:hypothetical protein